jgi:hypothetical protein
MKILRTTPTCLFPLLPSVWPFECVWDCCVRVPRWTDSLRKWARMMAGSRDNAALSPNFVPTRNPSQGRTGFSYGSPPLENPELISTVRTTHRSMRAFGRSVKPILGFRSFGTMAFVFLYCWDSRPLHGTYNASSVGHPMLRCVSSSVCTCDSHRRRLDIPETP